MRNCASYALVVAGLAAVALHGATGSSALRLPAAPGGPASLGPSPSASSISAESVGRATGKPLTRSEGAARQPAGSGQDDPMAEDTCRLTSPGELSGAVTDAGTPAPDGVPVGIIFVGGPPPTTVTSGGRYSLPLLALDCTSGRRWINFSLFAPGIRQNVTPQSDEVTQDLSIPPTTTLPAFNQPSCQLVLGTISGVVSLNGGTAPDGTLVTAETGPSSNLDQTAATWGGEYELSSLGIRCGSAAYHFLSTTLSVKGNTTTVTPTADTVIQDIDVRSCGSP